MSEKLSERARQAAQRILRNGYLPVCEKILTELLEAETLTLRQERDTWYGIAQNLNRVIGASAGSVPQPGKCIFCGVSMPNPMPANWDNECKSPENIYSTDSVGKKHHVYLESIAKREAAESSLSAAQKRLQPDLWWDDEEHYDSPESFADSDDLKIGDEFELKAASYWHEKYRVTKVPDSVSDDYECEAALAATPQPESPELSKDFDSYCDLCGAGHCCAIRREAIHWQWCEGDPSPSCWEGDKAANEGQFKLSSVVSEITCVDCRAHLNIHKKLAALLHETANSAKLCAPEAPKAPQPPCDVSSFPRRIQMLHWSEGEHAIHKAIDVVERMGCSIHLTDAVSLLSKAKDKVADFVDKVPEPAPLLDVVAECGQSSRDARILEAVSDPDIIYYGPHPCDLCGKQQIVRGSVEHGHGDIRFDHPGMGAIIYPNQRWVAHVCPAYCQLCNQSHTGFCAEVLEKSKVSAALRPMCLICHKAIHDLCKPRGSAGSRNWMMSIPARPDYDPDIVISDGLRAGREAIRALAASRKAQPQGSIARVEFS